MKFFVYILFSPGTGKYYVGQTEDLTNRLTKHNTGEFEGSSTKFGIPWEIFHTIECESRKQAVNIESHVKKMLSVKYYMSLKKYPEMITKLKTMYPA